MKVSLNTIKQFIDFELPPVGELVERINQQLGGVEEVIDLGDKYKDAVIVRVVGCEKHPNADRLSVCMIDAGDMHSELRTQDSELIQVVCGAPNVHADMWAIWLPPGATVPASYGDKDPFVLDVRDIRGVKSHGMLAAADELAIGSDHAGIIELSEDDLAPQSKTKNLQPGQSFAEVFGLDDTVIDIENKMFTHRPDLFGQLGVAREISAIIKGLPTDSELTSDTRFVNPDWYWLKPTSEKFDELPLRVFNDEPDKVPRLMAVAMQGVQIRRSPMWLQCALVAMGGKPINNVVDLTNYMMLMTAQPTHAYDYDKLHGATLGARMAKPGETASLLNGKNYTLSSDDIVIVDGEGVIGLAGIMGGNNSEVSETTTNIVLEVANFDMYTVRRSSMNHGLFTDALTRFNKGQSRLQNDRVITHLMGLMAECAGAQQASAVFDMPGVSDDISLSGEIMLDAKFVNDRLGTTLTIEQISALLRRVNFASSPNNDDRAILRITAPFWRTDIEQPEDIVEEVGRLYGFDKLPRELPRRSIAPAHKNERRETKRCIRDELSRAGANEVLTYSFIHENVLTRAGQNPEHAYRLSNAISPDLQYYRLSLTPSLLDKVHMNIKSGYDSFALFEINKVHFRGEMDEAEPTVPNEDTHLSLVIAYGDKTKPNGSPYYLAKKYLEHLMQLSHVELVSLADFDVSTDEWGGQLTAPYEPARSAVMVRDGMIWGVVGEFTSEATRAFKLPAYSAGFEVHFDLLTSNATKPYRPLSKYPSIAQDISLKVPVKTTYRDVYTAVYDSLQQDAAACDISLEPLSVYQADGDDSHKTISLRLTIADYERTLTDKDVNGLMDKAASRATDSVGAVRI